MIPIDPKPERHAERIVLSLPVKIEAYAFQDEVCREVTHLETVSDLGAGFYLSRSFEIGQLISLTMPLEKSLRRYDQDKEQYSIWGIVRHCYRTLRNNLSVYHIGVAFIGPEPPYNFRQNPLTIYQIGEIGENNFWQISVAEQLQPTPRHPRYAIPIDVYIEVCDAQNDAENKPAPEKTVTENISERGAAVFSSLQLNIGDKVKFIKQYGDFSATAIVRNRRVGSDNLPRLHLEFINISFPLEGID
jgi:hypothetical protein